MSETHGAQRIDEARLNSCMHRNTYLLVIFLALFAALVVGINIGRHFSGTTTLPSPTPSRTPPATPTPKSKTFVNPVCGFTLVYPNTLSVVGSATGSALLSNVDDPQQSISVACQKNIPRPAVDESKMETIELNNPNGASIAATLYHDTTAKDGTPIDEFIFRSPKNGADIFIAGLGDTYNEVIRTIQILP